jgi:hypothetical protein
VSTLAAVTASKSSILVVGASGSAAECLAVKAVKDETLGSMKVLLHDVPTSPALASVARAGNIALFVGDVASEDIVGFNSGAIVDPNIVFKDVNTLVIVEDEGFFESTETTPKKRKQEEESRKMFDTSRTTASLLRRIPTAQLRHIVATYRNKPPTTDENPFNKLLKRTSLDDYIKTFAAKNNIKYTILQHGRTTGGVPNREPVPFLTGCRKEPELHESFANLGVVITRKTSVPTKLDFVVRDTLGEALLRSLNRLNKLEGVQIALASVSGGYPSLREWEAQFARVEKLGREPLTIEFERIQSVAAVEQWLLEYWYPLASMDSEVMGRQTGSRPTRARKERDGVVKVFWEDVGQDMLPLEVGTMRISIYDSSDGTSPRIVVQVDENADLPGSEDVVRVLLDCINKNLYKREIASRLRPRVIA